MFVEAEVIVVPNAIMPHWKFMNLVCFQVFVPPTSSILKGSHADLSFLRKVCKKQS